MKFKIVCAWIFLALVLALAWYNHQYHCYGYPFITTSSGLSYKAIGKRSTQRAVKDDEYVEISIAIKKINKPIAKDQNSDQTAKPQEEVLHDDPTPCILPFDAKFASECKAISEMIRLMKEKQRVIFKCSPAYYLQLEDRNPEDLEKVLKRHGLDKDDQFVIEITLRKIMIKEEYDQIKKQEEEARLAKREAQLTKDKELITKYLAENHIQAKATDSGLFYIIDQSSQDTPVAVNKRLKVHYTGRLLDGTVFATSVEQIAKDSNIHNPKYTYQPFELTVGIGQVIAGWDEGLLLLKKHEKARFFIPSALAYREFGSSPSIPENAILIFEVEVLDIL